MRGRSLELNTSGNINTVSNTNDSSSSDTDDDEPVEQLEAEALINPANIAENEPEEHKWHRFIMRTLALLCAMSLSIGSHFGSYFLGPLKSRLAREIGTSNAEFSLMIAAFDLNSTWTPLVGGLLVYRFGTARSSIVATFVILLGQTILLIGDWMENVACMCAGLFIFGLGISPLAVVQETIVVRFFASHGLGLSLAIGLIAGKGASFVSARVSYPLSQRFGPSAPFVLSTFLALFSFGVNLIYLASSAWLARGAGVQLEPGERPRRDRLGALMTDDEAVLRVAEKRKVKLKDMARFGDVFWLYIALNVLCGAIWSPFLHLASNIIEQRYNMSEAEASKQASLLLAGSLFLYPICGLLTDRLKHGSTVFILFTISSFLTLICYAWLALPPSWTTTPLPAMLSFSGGHGFSTLLMVILVPHILPLSHVSTGLGAHKSIEKAGSTTSQTLAGLLLDLKGKKKPESPNKPSALEDPSKSLQSIQILLVVYLLINFVQFIGTLILWRDGTHLQTHPRHSSSGSPTNYQPIASEDIEPSTAGTSSRHHTAYPSGSAVLSSSDDEDSALHNPLPRQSDGAKLAGHLRNDGSWAHRSKPLLINPNVSHTNYATLPARLASPVRVRGHPSLARSTAQRRRGKIFMVTFFATIAFTWVLFMSTAIIKMKGPAKT